MQKQKKGFWLFISSLIPGAGEMYMGFRKQGLSIMILFWSIFGFGAATGMDWVIMFFPIVWFYSFYNVHNLKSLSEEEFYSIEDNYILHIEEFVGDTNSLLKKYRTAAAFLMLMFGGSILCKSLADCLYWILPQRLANMLSNLSYKLPQILIAIAIILAGLYLLSDKKWKLKKNADKTEDDEHFWEPYRPYQQPAESNSATVPAEPKNPEPADSESADSEPAGSSSAEIITYKTTDTNADHL